MHYKVLLGSLLALLLIPAAPAAANSVSNDEFQVSGRLQTFPCPNGCTSPQFTGQANGATYGRPTIGGEPYDAEIEFSNAPITGTATYSEQSGPQCGLIGSADSVSLTIDANAQQAGGFIAKESDAKALAPSGGTINGVHATFNFTYLRVGALALITLKSGTITVSYFYPGITPPGQQSSYTENVVGNGEAPAAFITLPTDVAADCSNPGPLNFSLIGDALVQTTG